MIHENKENCEYFGEIITIINSRPYKFDIRFYSYVCEDNPMIDEYCAYNFNDCNPTKAWDKINFIIRQEKSEWDVLFEENKTNLHRIMIFMGLTKIKNNANKNLFNISNSTLDEYKKMKPIFGEMLEKEILQFSYCISKYCPSWGLSIDDFEFNIKANKGDIIQWADSLYDQHLLKRDPKDFKNRFTGGKTGGYAYKINRENIDKIEKVLNSCTFEGKELNEGNLAEILSLEESDILEVKGSLEFDINRYLDGDNRKMKNTKLRKEVLKTVVAFLNSELRQSKYLIIGIIEKDKIKHIDNLAQLTDKYLLFGINNDYEKSGWDGFLLKLSGLINDHISSIAHNYFKISRLSIDDKNLCIIHFGWFNDMPNGWFYYDNDEFWVRISNSTRILKGEKMDEFKKLSKYRS